MIQRKMVMAMLLVQCHLAAIQQFNVEDFTITCKSATRARETGDYPIENPLQFQYVTQDGYSCLVVVLKEKTGVYRGAKVVALNYKERYTRDPETRMAVANDPNDYGIPGDYEFMYFTRGVNGERLYAFVDYGTNNDLREFLETIKLAKPGGSGQKVKKLQQKSPVTLDALKNRFKARLSN